MRTAVTRAPETGRPDSSTAVVGGRDLRKEEVIIEPNRPFRHYWLDLWRYRGLFFTLAWRDVAVRYKQTAAGVAWAVLQPLASMVIMTVVFSRVARLPSQGGAPYAVMVFVAMLPWQFFANSLAASSQSIVGNANLISKVYFPRLIIPASSIVVALVDFAVSAGILVVMIVWYHAWPTWRALAVPGLIVFAMIAAAGPGLIMTALSVRYRDVRFIVPFLIQFGLYASPVAYSSEVVRARIGERLFSIYALNPIVGVIDGFRWALLAGDTRLWWPGFAASVVIAGAVCAVGLVYFRGTEKTFADLV
jgi:lipopolysaccharide transport system permease protein